jgi:hypothetical protein
MEPKLTLSAAQAVVETKTAPRVTEASIKARIFDTYYLHQGTMTICVIEMVNGFKAVGTSACASPANYDRSVGERYAYDNAFKQLWALEAYLLLEKLSVVW